MRARHSGDWSAAPADPVRSRVLLIDGAVAGAMLIRREGDGADSRVICHVVAPRWRRSMASGWLMEAATRASVEDGGPRLLFDCDENNRDTVGIARRGGFLVGTDGLFRYAASAAA